MQKEIWKIIEFGTGHYSVSNYGRVKSNFPPKKEIIKKPKNTLGYHEHSLKEKAFKPRMILEHRLVAFSFIPNPNNKPFINHKNGIRSDNRVENLEWCTQKENVQHAWKTGLSNHENVQHGERSARARFKEKDILEMRHLYSLGESISLIAKRYSSRYDTIYGIVKGYYWKHLLLKDGKEVMTQKEVEDLLNVKII